MSKQYNGTVLSLKKKGTVIGYAIMTNGGNGAFYSKNQDKSTVYFSQNRNDMLRVPMTYFDTYADIIVKVEVNFNKELQIKRIEE